MSTSPPHSIGVSVAAVGTLLLSLVLLVSACSDDPILGPGDDSDDDGGGGSYSVIKRLAPADSADSTHVRPSRPNPERF